MNSESGPTPAAAPRVRLLGKPGCHLCDDARAVVTRVCSEARVDWDEQDITRDVALWQAHHERIPVVFVDDHEIAFWRVDEATLRAALAAGAAGVPAP